MRYNQELRFCTHECRRRSSGCYPRTQQRRTARIENQRRAIDKHGSCQEHGRLSRQSNKWTFSIARMGSLLRLLPATSAAASAALRCSTAAAAAVLPRPLPVPRPRRPREGVLTGPLRPPAAAAVLPVRTPRTLRTQNRRRARPGGHSAGAGHRRSGRSRRRRLRLRRAAKNESRQQVLVGKLQRHVRLRQRRSVAVNKRTDHTKDPENRLSVPFRSVYALRSRRREIDSIGRFGAK